jgi:hypothetical protein
VLLPQVGALRERIDELSEDLELARAAAAAAAAGTSAPAAAAAADGSGSNRSSAAGPAAVHVGDGSDRQQREQEEEEQHEELLRPASPGRELSEREVAPVRQVPLMAEDTPLEALHAQVRLNLNLNLNLNSKTCAPTSRCQSSTQGTPGGSRSCNI